MAIKIYLAVGLITMTSWAEAAKSDSIRDQYVQSYRDYFFLGYVIKKRNLEFKAVSLLDNKKSLTFKPNNAYSMGAAVNLFDVYLEATLSVPVDTKSKTIYGSTTASDLQLTAMGRQWYAEVYHQRYSGFYESSAQGVQPNQPYPQRSDIVTRNFGMSFAYIFNHEQFSLRSAYIFTEAQKVSRGSFLLNFVLSSFTMDADSSVVSRKNWSQWGTESSFDGVHMTALGMGPGYSYNYVYHKFFVNGTLSAGPAHYWTAYNLQEGGAKNDILVNMFVATRIGLGFTSKRFFGGLNLTVQSRSLRFGDVRFSNSNSTARLVVGFRFLETGILKKRAIDYTPIGGSL